MHAQIKLLTIASAFSALVFSSAAHAVIINFFDAGQVATSVASGATFDTIESDGYLFTYTQDKLFTGGYGLTVPIGRSSAVTWPNGVAAQAVTAGPKTGPAQITIKRVDGDVFDVSAFSARLLASTGGAGGAIEVMPLSGGEDAFSDPAFFNISGQYGQTFSYSSNSPSYLGSTSSLKGFDTYKFSLYVDFALTGLTLEDASVAALPEPLPQPAPEFVPEPGTNPLMLVGLGLIGAVVRRSTRRMG